MLNGPFGTVSQTAVDLVDFFCCGTSTVASAVNDLVGPSQIHHPERSSIFTLAVT